MNTLWRLFLRQHELTFLPINEVFALMSYFQLPQVIFSNTGNFKNKCSGSSYSNFTCPAYPV